MTWSFKLTRSEDIIYIQPLYSFHELLTVKIKLKLDLVNNDTFTYILYPVLMDILKVYDPNGDGVIDQSELKEIIKSCVAENGMEFDETQVDDLARALFEDAVKPGKDGISVDDLSDQFRKHKGLLENLTLSIGENDHINE